MRERGFRAKLAAVQANPAMHDTWRLLADYGASGSPRGGDAVEAEVSA